jgi:transposase-like protein
MTLNQAVHRIGERVGVVPDTLRGWVKQQRIDTGQRPGTTTSDAKRIRDHWDFWAHWRERSVCRTRIAQEPAEGSN